jgi:hypothetical protein
LINAILKSIDFFISPLIAAGMKSREDQIEVQIEEENPLFSNEGIHKNSSKYSQTCLQSPPLGLKKSGCCSKVAVIQRLVLISINIEIGRCTQVAVV